MRDKFDLKIYVECPDDIRLAQRVTDHMQRYGYDLDHILDYYSEYTKPAYERFIEPYKILADLIVPNNGSNSISDAALDMMI
jgi:uridine kinase